jgi:hypothetical protein
VEGLVRPNRGRSSVLGYGPVRQEGGPGAGNYAESEGFLDAARELIDSLYAGEGDPAFGQVVRQAKERAEQDGRMFDFDPSKPVTQRQFRELAQRARDEDQLNALLIEIARRGQVGLDTSGDPAPRNEAEQEMVDAYKRRLEQLRRPASQRRQGGRGGSSRGRGPDSGGNGPAAAGNN